MLALSAMLFGCDTEEDKPYYGPDETPTTPSGPGTGSTSVSLSASPQQLNYSKNGGTQNVFLSGYSTNSDYANKVSLSTSATWLTVNHERDGVFTVKAASNPGSERTGSVTFSSAGSSCSISVTQDGSGGSTGGDNTGGQTNQKPAAPTGLTAIPDGPSTAPFAMVKWNNVQGATSYIVYRSNTAQGSYSQLKTVTYASYADESVKYGNTYYYKVKAVNSYGQSDFSSYAECAFTDRRKPGPVKYGNCTVSGSTMTLRWTVPTDPSYGKPTKALLQVINPDTNKAATLQTLSGTATSVSFTYSNWVDKDGFVKTAIILENENGSGGGSAKVYDTKNKRWLN